MPTIYASVKKTGHLVIAHEAIKIGGVGGEIAARVAENHFDYLRGPVLRVGARFTPLPFSPVMEDFVLSGEKEILDAVLAAAGKSASMGRMVLRVGRVRPRERCNRQRNRSRSGGGFGFRRRRRPLISLDHVTVEFGCGKNRFRASTTCP